MKKFNLIVLSAFLAVTGAQAATIVNGAGATFPYPLYSKWFQEFHKVDSNAEINYQSVGSGAGIKQLLDKTVDFGASDAPMSDEELGKAGQPVHHIPTVLGAVVITYNLPEAKVALKMTAEVVAGLFSGKIKTWDDAKIAALNPGVKLPKAAVMPVYRSDGSGTTAVFTEYLAKADSAWKAEIGQGKSVKWPTGMGGKGNEGVMGLVKQTPGTVGYVELGYAMANKLPTADIKNAAGKFVAASTASVSAAAEGALKTMPKDFRVSITNAEGAKSYPISAFTYLLVYETMPADKGKVLQKFLNWSLADGQAMASPLGYAPLPKAMVKNVKAKVAALKTK